MRTPKKLQALQALIDGAVVASGDSCTTWCAAHNINPRTIYRWRRGLFRRPQHQAIALLAKAVGLPFEAVADVVRGAARGGGCYE